MTALKQGWRIYVIRPVAGGPGPETQATWTALVLSWHLQRPQADAAVARRNHAPREGAEVPLGRHRFTESARAMLAIGESGWRVGDVVTAVESELPGGNGLYIARTIRGFRPDEEWEPPL